MLGVAAARVFVEHDDDPGGLQNGRNQEHGGRGSGKAGIRQGCQPEQENGEAHAEGNQHACSGSELVPLHADEDSDAGQDQYSTQVGHDSCDDSGGSFRLPRRGGPVQGTDDFVRLKLVPLGKFSDLLQRNFPAGHGAPPSSITQPMKCRSLW